MRQYKFLFQLLIFCAFIFTTPPILAEDIRETETKAQTHAESADISDLNAIRVLDLRTAEQIALADNPSLDAAMERVRQAKERVIQARSTYWPRVDAAASGSRVWFSDKAYPPGADDPEDYYRAGLTAAWELFDGFERKFSVASAQFAENGSNEAQMNIRRLLLSSVATGYYNAMLASENIIIAEADKAFYQRQVEEARVRRRVGTGSLSDMLNFEIQVNSAKAELIKAKEAYQVAMFGLAALMGIPDAAFPPDMELSKLETETPEDVIPPEPDPLIAYALAHRPDILQNDYAVKQAESGIGIARAKLFPTLTLSASLEGERTGDAGFETDDFGNTVALSLSYNIFDAGANRSKIREAKIRKTEAEKDRENVRLTVISQVREAIANLKSAQEQLRLQRSNAGLVQQNRDLVEKEYAAGQTSLVRLNEAQRDLTAAQGRLALAIVSLRQAWYHLEVSTGQILVSSMNRN